MFWFKRRRREKIRGNVFPEIWEFFLRRNMRYYELLPPEDQHALRRDALVILDEKNFEGCGGLKLTDEIKVTIAGHASALLLHRAHDYYPRLDSILVYPQAFIAETTKPGPGSLMLHTEEVRAGEAWQRGVVIVSWNDVQFSSRGERPGYNVIYHEFAHQLDMENGDSDGVPVIGDSRLQEAWLEIFQDEYDQLVDDIDHDRITLLGEYASTSPSEFFAVATECFFESSIELRRRHPDLYEVMKRFYQQDPADLRVKAASNNEYI
jgi:hypothetical protein